MKQKTWTPKAGEGEAAWWVVDAEGQTLGRLASRIVHVLRGKHRPDYAPHLDRGDFVVVLNAERVHTTGDKARRKMYYRHSGYPGGLREESLERLLERDPEAVIRRAVKGMMPRGPLARAQLKKLKIYRRGEHPHQAQAPQELSLTPAPTAPSTDQQEDENDG